MSNENEQSQQQQFDRRNVNDDPQDDEPQQLQQQLVVPGEPTMVEQTNDNAQSQSRSRTSTQQVETPRLGGLSRDERQRVDTRDTLEESPVLVETVKEGEETEEDSNKADDEGAKGGKRSTKETQTDNELPTPYRTSIAQDEQGDASQFLQENSPILQQDSEDLGMGPRSYRYPEEEVIFATESKIEASGSYDDSRLNERHEIEDSKVEYESETAEQYRNRNPTIWFDNGTPVDRTKRRSADPMNQAQDNARRQSRAAFDTPSPMPPPNVSRKNYQPPGSVFVQDVQGGDGGGGGGDSSSSSSSSSTRTVCGICGGDHLMEDCPRRFRNKENHKARRPDSSPRTPLENIVTINGTQIRVRRTPNPADKFTLSTILNREERMRLSPEDKMPFDKQASGYVLSKNNKLRVQSILAKDEDILKQNYNVQYQVKLLKDHIERHDIGNRDVCTIVIPKDLARSPDVEETTYNLFEDYPKLTPEIIAASNAWYNMWVDADYLNDNQMLLFNLCKNNSEEILFAKCTEMYDTFHVMQRGGTLIFQLLLEKIQSFSEQKLEYLKYKVETLKISTLPGENVDTACSLISAAYKTFESMSTPTINRIPLEWSKTVIKTLQTTSVQSFNHIFKLEEAEARREADKNGGQPVWPSHEQLINLASAVYNRMSHSNKWNAPKAARSRALPVNPSRPPYNSNDRPAPTCWNCGQQGHTVPTCPKPRNQAQIDRNRDQFRNRNRNMRNNNGPTRRPPFQPRRKTIDGKPMILNRNQVYVLDQTRIRQQRQHAYRALQAIPGDLSRQPEVQNSPSPERTPEQRPAGQAHVSSNEQPRSRATARAVQDALRQLL